jgi:hypothetical protein
MTITLTTTPHDEGVPLDDSDWVEGGMPRQSYASPWAVASPKHAAIVRRQVDLRKHSSRASSTNWRAILSLQYEHGWL